MHHPNAPHLNRRQTLLALIGTALLPACGGGTDVAGVSSGGTGSFTSGTITGLGSVIVNGIRYEYDDTVSVTIDEVVSEAAGRKGGITAEGLTRELLSDAKIAYEKAGILRAGKIGASLYDDLF